MFKTKKARSKSISMFYNCLQIVYVTLERFALFLSDNILYQPGFDDRLRISRQLYENIISYVDEISTLVTAKDQFCITKEEQALFHLIQATDLLYETNVILSVERNIKLQVFELIYSLNQLIQDSISLFAQIFSEPRGDFFHYQIREMAFGAKKLYQSIFKEDVSKEIFSNINNFRFYIIIQKMQDIVVHICRAMHYLN